MFSLFLNMREPGHLYSSLSFVLIFIFIGLPVWWKATTVYRVSLPYSEIEALSSKKIVQRISVHVLLVEKQYPEGDLVNLLDNATSAKRTAQFTDGNEYVYEWAVRLAYQDETDLLLSGKTLEEIDTALHHMEHLRADNRLNVVVVPNGTFKGKVTIGLHKTIYFEGGEGLQDLARSIDNVVREDAIREDLLKRLFTSPKSQERSRPDKERMRPLSATTKFDVTFTLIVPEPQILDVSWKIQEAIHAYMGPFLDRVSTLATVNVKSQVLYLTDLKVQPHFDKEKGVYSLTADKLPLIINPVEGSSGLHASVNPALNFMVYVVPRAHHPLYVYDERGQPLETNAFLSPKWGGFLFYNVPKFPESGAALPARVDLDMRSIFQVFLGQLRLLMGLPDTRPKEGLHVMEDSVCSDLEVDFLLRRRTQDYLSMSVSSLFSLSQLLSTISNIVIKDEIGDLIYSSVHSAERSLELLSKGDLETAFKEAEAAFLASEKAFFDPSLLALLYFPDDQKYAIYIPLFLPISIPVLLSLRYILTHYRHTKTAKVDKVD
ncbi:GPI transamidase component PIG-S isoform X2 [Ixodes scapularis]|uniref:GPI transamidase component PIG-S isoform X2 n=1 Tax=Ixodes scapularis TaxID=6945 RepID=UPI001A9F9CBB|nr:GPI transamidase component PIG-S isoform X2 [Ixodes scapularis]